MQSLFLVLGRFPSITLILEVNAEKWDLNSEAGTKAHLWGTGRSCWLIMPAEVAALAFSNQDCIVARDFFFFTLSVEGELLSLCNQKKVLWELLSHPIKSNLFRVRIMVTMPYIIIMDRELYPTLSENEMYLSLSLRSSQSKLFSFWLKINGSKQQMIYCLIYLYIQYFLLHSSLDQFPPQWLYK